MASIEPSTMEHFKNVVSTEWLQENLNAPNLRIYDCTYYRELPAHIGTGNFHASSQADYDVAHIPGAVHLALQEDFSRADSPLRFTLPTPDAAARAFASRGVGDGMRVILYGRMSTQIATRFWWMLRWLGFDDAYILDGGFDKWTAEGRPVSRVPSSYPAASLSGSVRPHVFFDKERVLNRLNEEDTCIVDTLAVEVHSGEAARYPRRGRIPGSANVPYASLLKKNSLELNDPASARQAFAKAGVRPGQTVVTYCGSGIAATLSAFVLTQLNYPDVAVYDGSMNEWSADNQLPMEVDPEFR